MHDPDGSGLNTLAPPAFGVARSFSGRRWNLKSVDEEAAAALTRAHSLSPALARLLAARGIGESEVLNYLNPSLKHLMPDPLVLKDMDKAVARVAAALEAGQAIAVFGDYDVDGSASSALLADFLAGLGVNPRLYIPDRMTEGYGPSPAAMTLLAQEGIKLVVTVDCGAAAVAALDEAAGQGMDVVVLDHHRVETAPPAVAHVNPNQPGDESGLHHLCAAGVTFLFLVALNRHLRGSGFYEKRGMAEPDLRLALDLVGLATVCDVVPLIGLNRAFVRQGLARLGQRPGLKALAEIAKAQMPFTPYHLGFVFGPRINAGGRVGRSSLGADLLTTRDEAAAADFARQLDLHNRERQAIEKQIVEEALAAAVTQANAPFILAAGEGWHPGVVGIVAGRLKERFGKPSFVVGFEGGPNQNSYGRGSARSIPGIDTGAAIRAAVLAGVIESGGGHAMAAGFSLSANQLKGFQSFLESAFEGKSDALAAATVLDLDTVSSPAGAGPQLLEELALAGPYGAGNPEPLLAFPDVRVAFADIVGKDHIRLRLNGGGAGLQAIAFRTAGTPLGDGLLKARGQAIHVAGRLRRDEWNGQVQIQLEIEDAAPAAA
ncbi:MAG TPA: single-stranded-DNA-specific exonuclease RecJ [Rhizomicrobium sp.]|nr:single-stranded-DNA-specific exonuclease RecJ [Rhizomicrobium sp.]